jgi:hypothetical protein
MVYVVVLIDILEVNLTLAWTSELLYWLVLAWLCYVYLKSGRWKKFKV